MEGIDPFQTNFQNSQLKDPDVVIIQEFECTGKWPTHFNLAKQNQYLALLRRLFKDKNGLIWICLEDCNYPRMALYLPEQQCEAQNGIIPTSTTTGGRDTQNA
jgi:hypothetical protein